MLKSSNNDPTKNKSAVPLVFQIGFNKCGTTSIHRYFHDNGYSSIHWDDGKLARRISQNVALGQSPLAGYEKYRIFTDMEYLTYSLYLPAFTLYYKILDASYPGSRFILNTRPLNNWMSSRLKHENMLCRHMSVLNASEDDVISSWLNQWEEHHSDVRRYFQDRESDLLELDIETASGAEIVAFLLEFEFLNPTFSKTNTRRARITP